MKRIDFSFIKIGKIFEEKKMKDYKIVDTHHHFLPSEALKYARKSDGVDYSFIMNRFSKAGELLQDINKTLLYMEESGISVVLLNLGAWSPAGMETCKAINNGYAKIQKENPNKFITCCHVPVHEGLSAMDELKRGVEELGLQGITLVSSYTNITLDSELMMPLYEKILKYDIPIIVHPTLRRPLWGGEKYDLSTTISREYDIAKCVVEVLYGVLPRFPDLKFLMPHFGGGMQVLKYRLLTSHQPKDWDLPKELRGHGLTPRELKERGLWDDFHRNFDKLYFDTAGFGGSKVTLEAAVMGLRTDRITFGTDYPYEFREPRDVKDYISQIKSLNISENEKRDILGGNILRLFKIT